MKGRALRAANKQLTGSSQVNTCHLLLRSYVPINSPQGSLHMKGSQYSYKWLTSEFQPGCASPKEIVCPWRKKQFSLSIGLSIRLL
jgi:hypothetical protein